MTGTVTVYNGLKQLNITGKIIREYPDGFTIEDKRGVLWTASGDRAQRHHTARHNDAGPADLWS